MKPDCKTSSSFLRSDHDVFREEDIVELDCTEIEQLKIRILLRSKREVFATNLHAIDLIMQIKPSMLEGKRLHWAKNKWAIHNLFAHPAMQILAFLKCYKHAFWIHEVTVPKPLGKKNDSKE